ncbi:hypothetical protein QBC42DRAFT_282268 [Cladorrhinum samala]|uniref:Uncharacterized protein n=1 Tax=Cladorrhinum samala TaxID=585594 RepID=A0AAV9I667_9PEZI|nr:hypothetical protein QBC42DRAFT_282268 [Cladorrhinum samala]
MSDANDLLDAFKAAALSVTKLYKTSAAAQAKSRADGYQDCIEDLLAFLDKENLASTNNPAAKIRKWAMDRLTSPSLDSDDEPDKAEAPLSSPVMQRATPQAAQSANDRDEINMRDSATPITSNSACPRSSPIIEEVELVVPSQDTFTFQSSHPYPHDAAARLANLDLSDAQTHAARTASRNNRRRDNRGSGPRASLGRGAGQKRKVNLAEIFDLGSLDGKDVFGGGKRSRHA